MNWSHALLVVAILAIGGAIISASAESNAFGWRDEATAHWWKTVFIVIAVISGALAAGLWR